MLRKLLLRAHALALTRYLDQVCLGRRSIRCFLWPLWQHGSESSIGLADFPEIFYAGSAKCPPGADSGGNSVRSSTAWTLCPYFNTFQAQYFCDFIPGGRTYRRRLTPPLKTTSGTAPHSLQSVQPPIPGTFTSSHRGSRGIRFGNNRRVRKQLMS